MMNERHYRDACVALILPVVAAFGLLGGVLTYAFESQNEWAQREVMRNACKASLTTAVKTPDCMQFVQEDHAWTDQVEIERARRESCQKPETAARVPDACRNIE